MNTPTPDNPLLTAAIEYAARGWRVVPLHSADVRGCSCGKPDCGSPGKHPRTRHGLSDGTTDPAAVRDWWARWPRANVAVVCGRASGVWVVGPDGEQGVKDFAAMEAAHTTSLPGAVSRTQGGGRHLFFAWPADGEFVKNRKNHRGTKIDVRAEGEQGPGYVVAPPSVGERGRYEWESPPGDEFPQAPPWLVEWARRDEAKPPPPAPSRPPTPAATPDRADVHRRAVQYLNRCPAAVSGQRGHDALLWAARVLVWGFALPEHEALALLATYYNPRCQPVWSEKELLHKVREAGQREFKKEKGWLLESADPAHDFPPPVRPPATPAPPPDRRPWEVRPCGDQPGRVTAADLMGVEFPPARFAFGDLLTDGLNLLCGKSKQGKSWLAMQVAVAVAAGVGFGGRDVHQGDVLYLALEDTPRRLQSRLRLLAPHLTHPLPAALTLSTGWPKSHDGGLYHVAEWLEEHRATARMFIVDTFGRFRKQGRTQGYQDDYDAMGEVKALADQFGVSALVVHHVRKLPPGDDPFDAISGTNAIGGAADTMLLLDRKRGSGEARLLLTGRDTPDATVRLTFDAARTCWELGKQTAGIDADDGAVARTGSQIADCAAWLQRFLAEFAHPSKETEGAAMAAGFSRPSIIEAKARLNHKQGGPLHNKKFGGGEWWNGLGPPAGWKLRPAKGSNNRRIEDRQSAASGERADGDEEDGF